MSLPRPSEHFLRLRRRLQPRPRASSSIRIDWKGWFRSLERKRALLGRWLEKKCDAETHQIHIASRSYLARVSQVSFELDGIRLDDRELLEAIADGAAHKPVRPRQAQRLRNHVAILRRIGRLPHGAQPLETVTVVRWYTSISCGLSNAFLGAAALNRLTHVVGQINSPHLNVRPALEEMAGLYAELLRDPIVPSFNGILSRLLLSCHLSRCGLPPVLFDPTRDCAIPDATPGHLSLLLDRVQDSYDALLAAMRR